MFPSTYYHRRIYNDFFDRPSSLGFSSLDDPFFGLRTTSVPYYLRPRRYSYTSQNVDGTTDAIASSDHSDSHSKSIGNNGNPTNGNNQQLTGAGDEKFGTADMANQKDKFVINVDVSQFTPDEIQVKVAENTLIIEANHEEKLDADGSFVTRSFRRRYELPPDVNIQGVVSDLSYDGVLTVQAPKVHVAPPKERVIPVQFSAPTQPKGILKKK